MRPIGWSALSHRRRNLRPGRVDSSQGTVLLFSSTVYRCLTMDSIRRSLRRLTRHPGSSTAAILVLACCSSAITVGGSLIQRSLLDPIQGVPDQKSLVAVGLSDESSPSIRLKNTFPVYESISRSELFSSVLAFGQWSLMVGPQRESRFVAFVTVNYFAALRTAPLKGRDLNQHDASRGAPLVCVVSHAFWMTQLGGDEAAIGSYITVQDQALAVVGIAPKEFRGLDLSQAPDVFLPLARISEIRRTPSNYFGESSHASSPLGWLTIVGALPAGRMSDEILGQLAVRQGSGLVAGGQFHLLPLRSIALPRATQDLANRVGWLSALVALLILLCGSSTVAGILLLRSERQHRDLAIQLALGARPIQLGIDLAIDASILAVVGGLLSLPIMAMLTGTAASLAPPSDAVARVVTSQVGWEHAWLAAVGSAASTLLIGVLLFGQRIHGSSEVVQALMQGAKRISLRTRSALVVMQVAVVFVLLWTTLLFAQSIVAATTLNPNISADRVAIGRIPGSAIGPVESAWWDALRLRLELRPAIEVASWSAPVGSTGTLVVNGAPRSLPSDVQMIAIDPFFFQAFSIRPAAGRFFVPGEQPGGVVVSASLQQELGPTAGATLREFVTRSGEKPKDLKVIGVVPDIVTSTTNLRPLVAYVPVDTRERLSARHLTIRSAPEASIESAISQASQDLNAVLPSTHRVLLSSLTDRLLSEMASQRFAAFVLGALAIFVAVLTAVGMLIVADSAALNRRSEFAVRSALGAGTQELVLRTLRETAGLVVAGLIVGIALAAASSRIVEHLVFRVGPADPAALIVSAGAIGLLWFAVSIRPALRAARRSPLLFFRRA